MKITEDKVYTQEILKRADELIRMQHTDRLHVSDIVNCLLRGTYRRLKLHVQVDIKKNGIIRGKLLHDVLTRVIGKIEGLELTEKIIDDGFLVGTIDVLNHEVIEIKTTKKYKSIITSWLEQIQTYCYMTGRRRARLIVWETITDNIYTFLISFDEYDLELWKKEMDKRIDIANKIYESLKEGGGLKFKEIVEAHKKYIPIASYMCRYCEYHKGCEWAVRNAKSSS